MASSRDAAVVPVSKRQKVDDRAQLREMVALQHTTKTSIVDALRVLKKAGLLDDCVTKRDLKKAAEHHSSQSTPYGKVVERLELDAPGLKYLDICNPFAFLYYLATISSSFAAMMADCAMRAAGRGLRLVIYSDEMCPGNPFRPEKSRTLQCV